MDFNGFHFSFQINVIISSSPFVSPTLLYHFINFLWLYLFFATSTFMSKICTYILNYKILNISVFFFFLIAKDKVNLWIDFNVGMNFTN